MGREGTDVSMGSGAASGLVGRSADQWPWLAASGVLGLLLGVIALFLPGLAILSIAVLIGIVLIVQGALEIAAGVRAGTGATGRGWLLAFGILTLVAGLIVVFVPTAGIVLMVWGLILWFVIAGVHDLLAASSGREHRGWNIALGVISILVALILLFSPGTAVGVLALFIAIGFLFRGGTDLGLALAMRRANP